jgi:hypothetical protein
VCVRGCMCVWEGERKGESMGGKKSEKDDRSSESRMKEGEEITQEEEEENKIE